MTSATESAPQFPKQDRSPTTQRSKDWPAVAARAPRVSMTLKADIRPGVTGALESKVTALERHLADG